MGEFISAKDWFRGRPAPTEQAPYEEPEPPYHLTREAERKNGDHEAELRAWRMRDTPGVGIWYGREQYGSWLTYQFSAIQAEDGHIYELLDDGSKGRMFS